MARILSIAVVTAAASSTAKASNAVGPARVRAASAAEAIIRVGLVTTVAGALAEPFAVCRDEFVDLLVDRHSAPIREGLVTRSPIAAKDSAVVAVPLQQDILIVVTSPSSAFAIRNHCVRVGAALLFARHPHQLIFGGTAAAARKQFHCPPRRFALRSSPADAYNSRRVPSLSRLGASPAAAGGGRGGNIPLL